MLTRARYRVAAPVPRAWKNRAMDLGLTGRACSVAGGSRATGLEVARQFHDTVDGGAVPVII